MFYSVLFWRTKQRKSYKNTFSLCFYDYSQLVFEGKRCNTRQGSCRPGPGFTEKDFNQHPPSGCLSTPTQGKLVHGDPVTLVSHWGVWAHSWQSHSLYVSTAFLSKNSFSGVIISGFWLKNLLLIELITPRNRIRVGFLLPGTSTHRVNSFLSVGGNDWMSTLAWKSGHSERTEHSLQFLWGLRDFLGMLTHLDICFWHYDTVLESWKVLEGRGDSVKRWSGVQWTLPSEIKERKQRDIEFHGRLVTTIFIHLFIQYLFIHSTFVDHN